MKYTRTQFVLSIFILFLAIYIPLATAYAQEASSSSQESTSTPVTYQLPYPGMLPDNPLYFLKVIRDDLTGVFISKPLDKANFDLMQSDKDVEASYLLITQEQGKTTLALKTFSQAQDEIQNALTETANAKKQGYSIQEITKRLSSANQKHIQMLRAIGQQIGQNNTQTIQQYLNRAQSLANTIKTL